MGKINCFIGLLAVLTLTSACECAEFDIDIPTTPKLVLLCCPGPADTTILQLYKTVPVGNTYSGYPFLEDAKVDFKVNGAPLEMTYATEQIGSVPEGCWFAPRGFNAGDKVEVSAAADGAGRISASTILPPEPPIYEYQFAIDEAGRKQLRMTFTDDSEDEDWYGVAVECERTKVQDGTTTVEYSLLKPKTENTGLNGVTLDQNYVDVGFNGWTFGAWWYAVRVWPDSAFGQKEIALNVTLIESAFSWEGDFEYSMRYRVRLYRFTKEFFRYVTAVDNVANNNFAESGIAPMPLSYTNIQNGAGVLAGWTMKQTEWIYPQNNN